MSDGHFSLMDCLNEIEDLSAASNGRRYDFREMLITICASLCDLDNIILKDNLDGDGQIVLTDRDYHQNNRTNAVYLSKMPKVRGKTLLTRLMHKIFLFLPSPFMADHPIIMTCSDNPKDKS